MAVKRSILPGLVVQRWKHGSYLMTPRGHWRKGLLAPSESKRFLERPMLSRLFPLGQPQGTFPMLPHMHATRLLASDTGGAPKAAVSTIWILDLKTTLLPYPCTHRGEITFLFWKQDVRGHGNASQPWSSEGSLGHSRDPSAHTGSEAARWSRHRVAQSASSTEFFSDRRARPFPPATARTSARRA